MSIQFTNNVQDLYGTKSFRAHNMKNDFPKRLERHWRLRKTLDRFEKLKKNGDEIALDVVAQVLLKSRNIAKML